MTYQPVDMEPPPESEGQRGKKGKPRGDSTFYRMFESAATTFASIFILGYANLLEYALSANAWQTRRLWVS